MGNKWDRHLGKARKLILKNPETGEEDTFEFKQLPAEYLADFIELSKRVRKFQSNNPDEVIEKLDRDTLLLLSNLLTAMVKETDPTISEEVLKQFIAKHFLELIDVLLDVAPIGGESDALMKRVEQIKKIQNANSNSNQTKDG